MFLTAVLQAHTDSLPSTDEADTDSHLDDDTVTLPASLEKALAIPLQERLQPLPTAHRSRWV